MTVPDDELPSSASVRLGEQPGPAVRSPGARTALRWASRTHVGLVRGHNEDSLLTADRLLVVADGMGGHAAGEVASRVAVETLRNAVQGGVLADAVTGGVREANRAIIARSRSEAELTDMGTTVTGVALLDDGSGLLVFNVGDSRVYAASGGVLRQVTHDHSVVAELVASGALEPELAATHPERNVVTRALGVAGDVAVDSWLVVPVVGDRWLVCSDGLSNEVDGPSMAEVLTTATSPDAACDRLLELALAHGARDNVTLVVADVVAAVDPAVTDAVPWTPTKDDTQPRPTVLTEVPGAPRTAPSAAPAPPLEQVPLSRPAADPQAPLHLITDVP